MGAWWRKAQIPLRRLSDFRRNFPTRKVADTNHVADFHDLCPQLSPRGSFGKVGVMEFELDGLGCYTVFTRSSKRPASL